MNACEGARQSLEDPFSGVAQNLCQQRLPAVVAMQFEISDDAAKTFAGEFYSAIADGFPVDAAVSESRKAMVLECRGQEWATPVLYMRSSDGNLFELASESDTEEIETVVPVEGFEAVLSLDTDSPSPRLAESTETASQRLQPDAPSAHYPSDSELLLKPFRVSVGECLVVKLRVGQQEKIVLLDAGSEDSYDELQKQIHKWFREYSGRNKPRFNLIIGTHLQNNHLGGLVALMQDESISSDVLHISGLSVLKGLPKSIKKVLAKAPANSLCKGASIALEVMELARQRSRGPKCVLEEEQSVKMGFGFCMDVVCPSLNAYKHCASQVRELVHKDDDKSILRRMESVLATLGSLSLCISYRGAPIALLTSDAEEKNVMAGLERLGYLSQSDSLALVQLPNHGKEYLYNSLNRLPAERFLITGKSTEHDVILTSMTFGKRADQIVYAEEGQDITLVST